MAMITPERDLEESLVTKLRDLKYEYRPDIRDRAKLEANFREKFDALNRVNLTDGEFQRLLDEIVTPDVYEAARSLRNREAFIRDDGTPLNYTLVNIKDWCKNTFEVVNQLRINTDNSHHRYDVILLINGVPAVQIELKTLGISPRRAMEQIVDYKNDPGNGYAKTLLCFVQLFIVSNLTDTWYFANNNARHFAFDADERFLPIYQFAAEDNTKIVHLNDFAARFLAKCTLGQMISKYMVLIASEQKLLMMRPYQIYAVKDIVDCIDQNCGNGYIWHTTGSGKTLTSFKASTLLKTNDSIHKCLFVVDRKDLDRQTREEFNRFQENCVEENTNTAALVRRLLSDDYADKVIVTTIQKLGLALDETSKHNQRNIAQGRSTFKQRLEQLHDKRMVFIFDECHRSQFGENHKAIKEFFPNSQLFGFTGTPIFEDNATVRQIEGDVATLRTTKDLFQEELHAYTITDAIEDRNVLRFHVDYYKPKAASALKPGQPLTKQAVAQAILDKHDAATGGRRFNALLATASINDAIEYYEVFKKLQAERQAANPEFVPLKIADCLGSLDDLIAAEGRKLEALRQHKQGLMQQLFPQAGETQPRLRFPEFQDTQEWRGAPLGKLFQTTTGGTPDRARHDYWGGEVPWVTTSIVDFNVIESTGESISSAGLANSSAKVFPKRTVLMALYGQGKTRGKVAMLGVEAATNQACAAILPSDEVDPRFVFLNLSGRYEEIRANSNSGGQKNLSQALVRDLPFAYPKERAEQHRIAECLTALADQIAAQARKLATLKQHKRGLLQQLFPKPETA